jgi:hypothetical protein
VVFLCGIIDGKHLRLATKGIAGEVEALSQHPLLSRLRDRLSEAGMLDLAKRLIAIPSGNPPPLSP